MRIHKIDVVDRLNVSRKRGRRLLASIEDSVDELMIHRFDVYIKKDAEKD